MRTRQKVTAVGAFALAATAIVGGAFVTSHAMADNPPPNRGKLTVIAVAADSDGAVKCVYDDVALPTEPAGVASISGGGLITTLDSAAAGPINVVTGSGPVDAEGNPLPGVAMAQSTTATLPGGALAPEGGATLSINTGMAGAEPGAGMPPAGVGIVLDASTARLGTAEECAAMKPDTLPAPKTQASTP